MTATPRALSLARTMRAEIDASVDAATRDLIKAWSSAWGEISIEWAAAVDELITLSENGVWPSAWKIARAKRAQRALAVTRDALESLATTSGVRILRDVSKLVDAAEAWEVRLMAAQLPNGLVVDWARVDTEALTSIVKRTTGQVEALTRTLPAEQQAIMRSTLIRGVAVGENPRVVAREMMRRSAGAFEGGRRRAETIARTEMLDAHRDATLASRIANRDVLTGWQWLATLDARTCPACLAMHGETFGVDVPGPDDHQNGRCTSIPVPKPLADLGFTNIAEPPDAMPDAQEWFADQPEKVRIRIMGAERLRRLDAGELDWSALAQKRTTDGWRDSIGVAPLAAA